MRTRAATYGFAALLVGAALAQSNTEQERVFRLAYIEVPRDLQEAATVIRSIGEIRQLSVDAEQRNLSMRGTEEQIALAQWLIGELDQPAERRPAARPGQNPVFRQYRMSAAGDFVRVFYLSHVRSPRELQEVAVMVRTKTRIPRLFIYNPAMAIVVRGTAAQMAEAERLIDESAQRAA